MLNQIYHTVRTVSVFIVFLVALLHFYLELSSFGFFSPSLSFFLVVLSCYFLFVYFCFWCFNFPFRNFLIITGFNLGHKFNL